ncbi:uncharacterized protein TNCV_4119811 [Trichonephila clavipes]|nr:uncharacterized protein TNCV_4119811 [Trichonephila clavipes]
MASLFWDRSDEEIFSLRFRLQELNSLLSLMVTHTSGDRLITNTIARLRTGYFRGMKIGWDDRTYRNCDKCLDKAYIFDCPAILADLQEIGVMFSTTNLYIDNIEQMARTVSHLDPWYCVIWSRRGHDIIFIICYSQVTNNSDKFQSPTSYYMGTYKCYNSFYT